MVLFRDAVSVVEDLALGQVRRQLPFSATPGFCGVKATAGVAERLTEPGMEADADATGEEAATRPQPDLEATSSVVPDALVSQKGGAGIEREAAGIGDEGSGIRGRGGGTGRGISVWLASPDRIRAASRWLTPYRRRTRSMTSPPEPQPVKQYQRLRIRSATKARGLSP